MEFRQLQYFLGVANELHFSKAAEKLFIAQPALSRQIQALEENLGVLLFERDKRNVKLTPAGEYLREHHAKMLANPQVRHAYLGDAAAVAQAAAAVASQGKA